MFKLINKRIIMTFMLVANFISRRVNKIKYKTGGKCNKYGNCCKLIVFRSNDKQLKSKYSLKLCIRWLSWFYDFDLLGIDYKEKLLLFSCKHRKKDESCDNYFWRPPLCRDFPFSDFEKKPGFLPMCGYNAY